MPIASIEPLAARYVYLKFTDTNVRRMETTTSPKDVHWLAWPEEGVPVSADGLHMTGRWERTGDGHKVSVWDFTAKRE